MTAVMQRRELLTGLLAAWAAKGTAVAAPRPPGLRVVSFNVLAPIWAAPRWYPEGLDPRWLERTYRRSRITAFLRGVAATTDAFCLQEVNEAELPHYLAAAGPDFEGIMAYNDRNFWSNWLVPELPWEPNGTALLAKKTVLAGRAFTDLPIGSRGNHMVRLEATHKASGRRVRLFSVHLDSDNNNTRIEELDSLFARTPAAPDVTDVIAGDINEDTILGSASNRFAQAGFVDVLASVGNREPTHPFTSSYNQNTRWGVIDHVLVRHGTPTGGDVYDFGVWSISDEVARIAANLEACGSDHFPLWGAVSF